MCPNLFRLFYLENANLTKCKTCGHAWYKPRTDREKCLVTHKNQDTLQSLIDCKDYSCLQKLLST